MTHAGRQTSSGCLKHQSDLGQTGIKLNSESLVGILTWKGLHVVIAACGVENTFSIGYCPGPVKSPGFYSQLYH